MNYSDNISVRIRPAKVIKYMFVKDGMTSIVSILEKCRLEEAAEEKLKEKRKQERQRQIRRKEREKARLAETEKKKQAEKTKNAKSTSKTYIEGQKQKRKIS